MAPAVKICGITRVCDAVDAAAAGADYVGLIFCPSPRQVRLEIARAVKVELPSTTKLVGVFKDQPVELVNEVAREARLDLVQLHGSEGTEYIEQMDLPVIKVFTFHADENDLLWIRNGSQLVCSFPDESGMFDSFAPYMGAKYFLFDKPKGVEVGDPLHGLELLFQRLVHERSLPRIFIAGALTDSLVRAAIDLTNPFAVDVASGVEQSPGLKSKELMQAFISSAKMTADIGV